MARGNNGHLLQHGIECSLANCLASPGITLLIAHGMRPFESFQSRRGSSFKLLDSVLRRSAETSPADLLLPVERAYRETRASQLYYPNSIELIANLVEPQNLCGIVAEVHAAIAAELSERWKSTRMEVVNGSWREVFDGVRGSRSQSWLASLDPNTYTPGIVADDANFNPSDWDRLERVVGRLRNGARGAICVFCYELKRERPSLPGGGSYERFLEDGEEFAQRVELAHAVADIQGTGGNLHVGHVFATDASLAQQAVDEFQHLCCDSSIQPASLARIG